jgi:RNA polymerase sigma-70 factor, ECF subfamily
MADNKTLELVIMIIEGDEDACQLLVRRYYRFCYSVALSILKSSEDAEDVAQQSLFSALSNLNKLLDFARFRPWIRQIVKNKALTMLKRQGRHTQKRSHYHEMENIPGKEDNPTLKDSLMYGLLKLSEREREVLLLHDMDGWKHHQIGELLEISETNSRQFLFVARKKMRRILTQA